MPRSIRGRLTLWLALLIALCLAAFALSLYVAVRGALIGDLDHTLRVQAQQIATTYDFGGQDSGDNTGQHSDIGAVDQFTTGGVYVETFDAGGHIRARSSNLGTRSLPLPAPAATLLWAAPRVVTLTGSYGALRLYSLPARSGGQTVGLVVVGASLHEVTTTTQTLLAALAVAGVIAVTLAALGVGALVRRGLRPLDAMAVAVEGIDAHDLDRRLGLRAPPVEVARLARVRRHAGAPARVLRDAAPLRRRRRARTARPVGRHSRPRRRAAARLGTGRRGA